MVRFCPFPSILNQKLAINLKTRTISRLRSILRQRISTENGISIHSDIQYQLGQGTIEAPRPPEKHIQGSGPEHRTSMLCNGK